MSKIWFEGSKTGFTVDMGSANTEAIEILLSSLEGFAELNNIIIEGVILG